MADFRTRMLGIIDNVAARNVNLLLANRYTCKLVTVGGVTKNEYTGKKTGTADPVKTPLILLGLEKKDVLDYTGPVPVKVGDAEIKISQSTSLDALQAADYIELDGEPYSLAGRPAKEDKSGLYWWITLERQTQ